MWSFLFTPGCLAGPWYMASSGIWKLAKLPNPSFLEALCQPNYTAPYWRRLGSAAPKFNNHWQERGAREADSVADREEEEADVGEEQEEHAEVVEELEKSVTCLQPWWGMMSLMSGTSWFQY